MQISSEVDNQCHRHALPNRTEPNQKHIVYRFCLCTEIQLFLFHWYPLNFQWNLEEKKDYLVPCHILLSFCLLNVHRIGFVFAFYLNGSITFQCWFHSEQFFLVNLLLLVRYFKKWTFHSLRRKRLFYLELIMYSNSYGCEGVRQANKIVDNREKKVCCLYINLTFDITITIFISSIPWYLYLKEKTTQCCWNWWDIQQKVWIAWILFQKKCDWTFYWRNRQKIIIDREFTGDSYFKFTKSIVWM